MSRSRMQRYQNWQSSVRKFYTEQIRNVEKQREERNELVKRLNERDAPGTLKTALQLVDHLTGENIYFKMSLAMRSGIEDREFDAIVEECAQFLISPLTVKEQIREIVNLLNEM